MYERGSAPVSVPAGPRYLRSMSSLPLGLGDEPKPSKRKRAGRTVDTALRGGILGAAAATIAWLLASALFGTAIVLMVVVTIIAAVYTVARGDKARYGIWGLVAIGWAASLVAHWAVSGHGGFFAGIAAWLGVIIGARRAGISKWTMPFLAFPIVFGVLIVIAGQSLLHPWGVSWLWLAAVLGPVIGIRTLLNPSPREKPTTPTRNDPLAGL
jgi:hypothetical protein